MFLTLRPQGLGGLTIRDLRIEREGAQNYPVDFRCRRGEGWYPSFCAGEGGWVSTGAHPPFFLRGTNGRERWRT